MRLWAVSLAAALLVPGSPAVAQQVAVAADVPVASPVGAGTRNLAFGVVVPIMGQIVDVDVPAATAPVSGTVHAGEFRYDVTSARGLDFILTTPAALLGPGLPPLGVTFDGLQYGGYCIDAGAGCTLTVFNPAAPGNVRVCARMLASGSCHPNRFFAPGTELGVYIGGRLSVPPTARAGIYSGVVTLTIVQVY
ncbi:MAG TPA: hypothetical protein VFZ24_09105 [Longimicrobiales bacterium]